MSQTRTRDKLKYFTFFLYSKISSSTFVDMDLEYYHLLPAEIRERIESQLNPEYRFQPKHYGSEIEDFVKSVMLLKDVIEGFVPNWKETNEGFQYWKSISQMAFEIDKLNHKLKRVKTAINAE